MTPVDPDASPPTPSGASAAGRARVIIDRVAPEIDGGRFPIKRSVGEWVDVRADVFVDGHDVLAGVVKYRQVEAAADDTESTPSSTSRDICWREVELAVIADDVWSAAFQVSSLGRYEYTVEAWVDRFASWLTS